MYQIFMKFADKALTAGVYFLDERLEIAETAENFIHVFIIRNIEARSDEGWWKNWVETDCLDP